jgi:hypothetical protein
MQHSLMYDSMAFSQPRSCDTFPLITVLYQISNELDNITFDFKIRRIDLIYTNFHALLFFNPFLETVAAEWTRLGRSQMVPESKMRGR